MKGSRQSGPLIDPRRGAFILMAVAGLVLSMGLMWGLPNHWDFAQDSVVPLGQLARIRASSTEVTQYRYPPFHLYLLDATFVPVRWLVEHTGIGENKKLSATLFILTARLVSVAMALGAICILWRIGERLWGRRVGIAAAALFLLSPVTLYYAKSANLDMPYLFWLAVALFFYVRLLQEGRQLDYVALGLTAALAVCTKDQAYAFFVLMPIPIVQRILRRPAPPGGGEGRWTAGRWLWALVGLLVFEIAFGLIHRILFDPMAFVHHLRTIVGPASEGWRECTAGPAGQLRLLLQTLFRLMDAWTPAGVFLATLGVAIALRDRSEGAAIRRALLIPAASYYLFFPAVVGYVYARFVMPLTLVLSLFGGAAAVWLWERAEPKALARALAVGLVAWVALAGLSVNWAMARYPRYDAQRWLETQFPEGKTLHYLGDMRDMPRFNEPLNALPLADEEETSSPETQLRRKRPELLVVSLEPGDPATGTASWRLAGLLSRALDRTDFGRQDLRTKETEARRRFMLELVRGKLGYRVRRRFQSPIAPFVPEVCESLNRTIVILERE